MSLIVLSIPIFFSLIALELIVTGIQHRKLYRLNDAITNISCGITEQISGIFAKILAFGLYLWLYNSYRLMDVEQTWLNALLLLVGIDFCYYWAHRMSHEINLFWAGHVVHHQSEDYNLSVALRQGMFQKFFTQFFFLPLALMGVAPEWFIYFTAIDTLYQFWIHTQTIGKLGPLEWIIVTPSHHRVHHGRDPKYIDKNHGGMFIIWDRLFGTYQEEEEAPTYGITTPVNTWNPLYAQVAHFVKIGQDLGRIPGLGNKLLYLVKKPGWLPDSMGGYQAVQPVDKSTYRKFDIPLPQAMNRYLLVQFLLVLAVTAGYLNLMGRFSQEIQWDWGIWVFLSCASLGLLMERKRWAWGLEAARMGLLPVLLYLSWMQLQA